MGSSYAQGDLGDRTWPIVSGPISGVDAMRLLHMARYSKSFSMLAHLKKPTVEVQSLSTRTLERDQRKSTPADTKIFPLKYVNPLITQGFLKKPSAIDPLEREDVTGKLAALLLLGGGGRRSEPLHLWVNDVTIVRGEPFVVLRHPQFSFVEMPDKSRITREEYLKKYCGMLPRNVGRDERHSGWKGMKSNTDGSAIIYWLPMPGIKEQFLACFLEYMQEVRPRLIRERLSRGLPDHPFLLLSSGEAHHHNNATSVGDPYSYVAFGKSWQRALKRLQGLFPEAELSVEKNLGTTLHGLRHLYGRTLKRLGLPPEMIQECMHHVSPRSQLVYGTPTDEEVNAMLSAVAERIQQGHDPLNLARFKTTDEVLIALGLHGIDLP